jgi:hypothetical protein
MLWLVFELPLGVIEYKLTSPGENIFHNNKVACSGFFRSAVHVIYIAAY